jgi:phosphomannomutase
LKLFGTSGIRGRTFKEITPHLAEKVGRAFALYLGGEGKVIVGRDTRYGAETIEYAVVAGLAGAGVDVLRCGEVPTPALAYCTEKFTANGAVMITGSHMPPDRIGIIPMLHDGAYLYGPAAEAVERHIFEESPALGLVQESEKAGKITIAGNKAIESYKRFLLEKANQTLLRTLNLRILVDSGNGTACHFADEVLRDLGCDTVPLNDTPSGAPNRSAEPRAETLQDTLASLREEQCDLGVAFDLDADRVLFLTPNGVVSENLIGLILADAILEGRKQESCLVLPINTSGLIASIIQKYPGTNIDFCKIGQPATIDAVKKQQLCVFAFEESGKYYFVDEGILWTDGGLTVIRVLEILAQKEISLDQLASEYPQYTSMTKSIRIPEGQGQKLHGLIATAFKIYLEDQVSKLLEVDGFRATFPDGAWLLIRPSGTEPLIRIVADAPSEARAQSLLNEGIKIIKNTIEESR